VEAILAFLASLNCYPTLYIVEAETTFYSHGVVYISRPITDAKIVHELAHVCQDDINNGPAWSWGEWNRREVEAKQIELLYLNSR
jgi:hypothetical protein